MDVRRVCGGDRNRVDRTRDSASFGGTDSVEQEAPVCSSTGSRLLNAPKKEQIMSAIPQSRERQHLSWFVFFGLMASVTFVGILSELLPSGVLPQMTEGLGVAESQVGFLVGVYALASAGFAIPLVSATLAVNRKKLLITLLIGFAISNLVVAVSASYAVIVACRVLGGICAGVMWPMIAAYGTRLVPEHMHGRAITVIMSGNTMGISIGLPMMTAIGITFGWRTEFVVLGLTVVLIALLSYILPAFGGRRSTHEGQFRCGDHQDAIHSDRAPADLPLGRRALRYLHLHHSPGGHDRPRRRHRQRLC